MVEPELDTTPNLNRLCLKSKFDPDKIRHSGFMTPKGLYRYLINRYLFCIYANAYLGTVGDRFWRRTDTIIRVLAVLSW